MPSPSCSRRIFLQAAGLWGAAALPHWTPRRRALGPPPVRPLRIATLSDAHLHGPAINPRFAHRLDRCVQAIHQAPVRADLALFGGDLWRMGQSGPQDPLGALQMPVYRAAGEHDWYHDLGDQFLREHGAPTYSLDRHGVHIIVLMSMYTPDFWSGANLTAAERMHTVAALGNAHAAPFELGAAQLAWLAHDLSQVHPQTPIVVMSHGPLNALYEPWHFGTRDGAAALALLQRFESVTLLHGHSQRAHAQHMGHLRSYGMLSTAWAGPAPWAPRAPQGAHGAGACGWGELIIESRHDVRYVYHAMAPA